MDTGRRGVHTCVVFFGMVCGSEGSVHDVAALGDGMNTAALIAPKAGPGGALISDAAFTAVGVDLGDLECRRLELKGKSELVGVRVICFGGDAHA